MTNKLPVVGKRYRPLQKESFAWAEFKKFSLLNDGILIFCNLQQVCDDGQSNGYYSCRLTDFWERFEEVPEDNLQKPEESEPKWLPISCAPKCGSVITVQEKDNQRHKIFKAQWFLNKWYSLYKEGGNEEVHPEFWLEGSKEERETDTKEEHIEPVSIWKDVSELPEFHCQVLVKFKNHQQIFLYDCDGRNLMDYNGDELALEYVESFAILSSFINSFEQMQKDIEELMKKL